MKNDKLFWYVRIEKTLDAYEKITNKSQLNRKEILSSLQNKGCDYYIQTYFFVSNAYKKELKKINPVLSFLIEK